MEQIASQEPIELAYAVQDRWGTYFQYWISLTFAGIAAAHVAGRTLNLPVRCWLAALYLLATVFYISLYLAGTDQFAAYRTELESRGVQVLSRQSLLPVFWIRMLLWALGTVTCVWFLLRGGAVRSELHAPK